MSDKTKATEKDQATEPAPKAAAQMPTMVFSAQEYKHRQIVEAQEQAQRQTLDETEPGGRYLLPDGKTFVDANGEPIKDKGD